MNQMTIALTRLPDLSREDFQSYWFEHHSPLVRQYADLLGIVGYIQLHTLAAPPANGSANREARDPPFDGLALVRFLSREDFEMRLKDPQSLEASRRLADDERKFIDHTRSRRWWSEQRTIL